MMALCCRLVRQAGMANPERADGPLIYRYAQLRLLFRGGTAGTAATGVVGGNSFRAACRSRCTFFSCLTFRDIREGCESYFLKPRDYLFCIGLLRIEGYRDGIVLKGNIDFRDAFFKSEVFLDFLLTHGRHLMVESKNFRNFVGCECYECRHQKNNCQ